MSNTDQKLGQYVHGNRKEMSCWLRWYYFPWIMVGAKVWECHAPCTLAFYEKEDALYQIHKTQSLTFHHLIRGRNCLPFASSWFHTNMTFLFCYHGRTVQLYGRRHGDRNQYQINKRKNIPKGQLKLDKREKLAHRAYKTKQNKTKAQHNICLTPLYASKHK
jgi:hypothetical protein